MPHISYKTRITVGISLGCLAILLLSSIAALYTYNRWRGDHYFGEITRIDDGRITIVDPHIGPRTVLVATSTIIAKGRSERAMMHVGDPVLIIGSYDGMGNIIADTIRIVRPHPPEDSHDAAPHAPSAPPAL